MGDFHLRKGAGGVVDGLLPGDHKDGIIAVILDLGAFHPDDIRVPYQRLPVQQLRGGVHHRLNHHGVVGDAEFCRIRLRGHKVAFGDGIDLFDVGHVFQGAAGGVIHKYIQLAHQVKTVFRRAGHRRSGAWMDIHGHPEQRKYCQHDQKRIAQGESRPRRHRLGLCLHLLRGRPRGRSCAAFSLRDRPLLPLGAVRRFRLPAGGLAPPGSGRLRGGGDVLLLGKFPEDVVNVGVAYSVAHQNASLQYAAPPQMALSIRLLVTMRQPPSV